jgi:hypothetical protein
MCTALDPAESWGCSHSSRGPHQADSQEKVEGREKPSRLVIASIEMGLVVMSIVRLTYLYLQYWLITETRKEATGKETLEKRDSAGLQPSKYEAVGDNNHTLPAFKIGPTGRSQRLLSVLGVGAKAIAVGVQWVQFCFCVCMCLCVIGR